MKRYSKCISILALCIVVFLPGYILGQEESAKKELSIEEYMRWRTVSAVSISDNGKWASFSYKTRQTDDTLYVKSLETEKEFMIPSGSRPKFSDDSKWIAYTVSIPFNEAQKLRRKKKKVYDTVELLNVETGRKISRGPVASVAPSVDFRRSSQGYSSFSFSKGSQFFAIKKALIDTADGRRGSDVILHNLDTGFDELIGSVSDYKFNKPGSMLAYIVDAAGNDGNGTFIVNLESNVRKPLDTDTLDFAQLTWDEEGSVLSFLKGQKKKGLMHKENILLAYTELSGSDPERYEFDPAQNGDLPENTVISEKGKLVWSKDLTHVFFGIKEQEKEIEKKKDDEPKANVDIFHWQDPRLQSVQKAQAARDRNFTFTSVFFLKEKRFKRIADESMRTVTLTRDGNWGVGMDERAYISDWKEARADYFRVDPASGERTLIVKSQLQNLQISPDSRHLLYWKDGHFMLYDIERNETKSLTENAPVGFTDMEEDHVGIKPPYGIEGWTKDEKSVVLRHRYDLWSLNYDDNKAVNLTSDVGSKNEIRFRYIKTDPEEHFINMKEPVLLSAYGQWTKMDGFYKLQKGKIEKLVYEDRNFGTPVKAKEVDRVLYTIETFADFPNLYTAGMNFDNPVQITDANPWQSEYKWGNRLLFDFYNKNGVRLQGILAVPDDLKQGQKLPMLVNFYEKSSQNLHRYSTPAYYSMPAYSAFVSNGYLVMQPDIHFNTRTTHDDMLDCVEAATRKVIEMGYADPEKIALQGHSFSGGGASYIATRSKMFAAIEAGAAPINLVGEFNILFKGAGGNNHSYDIHGQGRYGVSPYDDFDLLWSQSPIAHVKTMDTPLLLLHGVDDPIVEYNQGMEFYNALRFLGKPIIFLSYPGEKHGLRQFENQKDFTIRLQQFFDHYLKGKPAPDWMINGVPFLKKKK